MDLGRYFFITTTNRRFEFSLGGQPLEIEGLDIWGGGGGGGGGEGGNGRLWKADLVMEYHSCNVPAFHQIIYQAEEPRRVTA